jgi:hypothetical protein
VVGRADLGVHGTASAPNAALGFIFVGLVRHGIAQGRPVAGSILSASGPYRLAPVPDGRDHVLAAALPVASNPITLLLPGDTVLVGHASPPLVVTRGMTGQRADIALRLPLRTEPPLLAALAAPLRSPPLAVGEARETVCQKR